MSIINFEDYIAEGAVKEFKSDKNECKAICDSNKDRIGKTIMNADGKEVSNSIVLSANSMAIKTGDKIAIRVINKNYNSDQVYLSVEEIKELYKLI